MAPGRSRGERCTLTGSSRQATSKLDPQNIAHLLRTGPFAGYRMARELDPVVPNKADGLDGET